MMMKRLIKVFSMILNCLVSLPNLKDEKTQPRKRKREIPIGIQVEKMSLLKNPPETAHSILATEKRSNSKKEKKERNSE